MRATIPALAIAALLAFAALTPAVSARAADGPDAVIAAIYKRVAAGNGERGGQFVWLRKKDRARWLSGSLVALWNAEEAKTPPGDETPPGFDPVSDSQDPKVRNVAVTLEKSDAGSATVAASFDSWSPGLTPEEQKRNPPDPKARITVRYDMVRERGRWLIDEIRGGSADKPWSIRAILKGFNGN
jgi:hypothetical protein